MQARMEALQSQINPHFLFNTLNSVSSLVRFDPDTARELIVKLANILRRLLRKTDAFVPLSEEIQFIDDYLDIEVVRFGRDKLKVLKELDPLSLDMMVPSMLLQPLVENSIKHAVAQSTEPVTVRVSASADGSKLRVLVEDDGGNAASGGAASGSSIGLVNVAQRLTAHFGSSATLTSVPTDEGGYRNLIVMPLRRSS